MDRRTFLATAAAAALAAGAARAEEPLVSVAKSPTCGCCGAWVERMRAAGFRVDVQNVPYEALESLKARVGVTDRTSSCHTAMVEGYFVEGHVPPADVRRLLAERPDAKGLAVPGMPAGSPGMEMGDEKDPYDTILVGMNGDLSVFERHR